MALSRKKKKYDGEYYRKHRAPNPCRSTARSYGRVPAWAGHVSRNQDEHLPAIEC